MSVRIAGSLGSSPRVRGTVFTYTYPRLNRRFIPAGAGNGVCLPRHQEARPVHPRGCGERVTTGQTSNLHPGSSPRVRGTVAIDVVDGSLPRFIPAGAGNGGTGWAAVCLLAVHPRGCGERPGQHKPWPTAPGSSPRVRGTVPLLFSFCVICRFIPAGAGNGSPATPCSSSSPVHPRGCGERNIWATSRLCRSGSSPRVRGTDWFDKQLSKGIRFIPAGAGNGSHKYTADGPVSVHPRGCGERPRCVV